MNEANVLSSSLQTCKTDENFADILFLVDESGSISFNDFTLVKNFLLSFVEQTEVGPTKTQFSILEYSTQQILSLKFNTYTSKAQIQNFILNMNQMRESTYTGEALEFAYFNAFNESTGARSVNTGVKRIIIVLTDGQSDDPDKVIFYSKWLRNKLAVTIYSVGVGPFVNRTELFIMSGDESRTVTTADFNQLVDITSSVRRSSCLTPAAVTPS